MTVKTTPDLVTYDEAMKRDFVEKLTEAKKAGLNQIESTETWTQVTITSFTGNINLGSWALRIKRPDDGDIKKFKSRFCVRGNLQDGVNETHAPVA